MRKSSKRTIIVGVVGIVILLLICIAVGNHKSGSRGNSSTAATQSVNHKNTLHWYWSNGVIMHGKGREVSGNSFNSKTAAFNAGLKKVGLTKADVQYYRHNLGNADLSGNDTPSNASAVHGKHIHLSKREQRIYKARANLKKLQQNDNAIQWCFLTNNVSADGPTIKSNNEYTRNKQRGYASKPGLRLKDVVVPTYFVFENKLYTGNTLDYTTRGWKVDLTTLGETKYIRTGYYSEENADKAVLKSLGLSENDVAELAHDDDEFSKHEYDLSGSSGLKKAKAAKADFKNWKKSHNAKQNKFMFSQVDLTTKKITVN